MKSVRNIFKSASFAVLLTAMLASLSAHAASPAINGGSSGRVAIEGYDAVSYHQGNQPAKGDAAITHEYMDAVWQFSSMENRDKFAANPDQFAPQYGGYCAYAAAKNYVAPVDPLAWTVHNGKLYLNYSKGVRKTWQEKIDTYISKADTAWPGPLGN